MSETVHYIGRLIPVAMSHDMHDKVDMEQTACRILMTEGMDTGKSEYDTWIDQLKEDLYKKYVVINTAQIKKIYKIDMEEIDEYNDIFISSQKVGCIEFQVKYNTGVLSFEEAIEHVVEKAQQGTNEESKPKFNEIERLLALLKEAVNSDKTPNSDKALYLLLEQYKECLPELEDNRFHKSFRQTNVTGNDAIDSSIYSLLNTSALFWNIFEKVQQEKRLHDGR